MISRPSDIEVIKSIIDNKEENLVYKGFWNKNTAVLAVRYVVLEHLKLKKNEIKTKYSVKILEELGFRSVRKFGNVYELLTIAIPEYNLMPWEIRKLPNNSWTEDNVKDAVNWLVYEVLDTTPEKANITQKLLDKHNLGHITRLCGRSTKNLMELVYPKKYFGE